MHSSQYKLRDALAVLAGEEQLGAALAVGLGRGDLEVRFLCLVQSREMPDLHIAKLQQGVAHLFKIRRIAEFAGEDPRSLHLRNRGGAVTTINDYTRYGVHIEIGKRLLAHHARCGLLPFRRHDCEPNQYGRGDHETYELVAFHLYLSSCCPDGRCSGRSADLRRNQRLRLRYTP